MDLEEWHVKVLVIDGHPGEGRLASHLLETYAAALGPGVEVERFPLREMPFDPVLHEGYQAQQPWEPHLERIAQALLASDHLVVGFPLWWGAEPAPLKGLLDRLLLPDFAFRRLGRASWERLLSGRSADVIITADTPAWYLRFVYGNPVVRRWRQQVLGYCGFHPVRVLVLGPVPRGDAEGTLGAWRKKVARLAQSAPRPKRAVGSTVARHA